MKPRHPATVPNALTASRLRKRLGGPQRQRSSGMPTNSRIHPGQGRDLQRYQAELETQNKALRFTQAAAESAYERFVTLFSIVPLALMVVLEDGQILQNNAQALALLQPLETDPPLTYLFPLFSVSELDRVTHGFAQASEQGVAVLTELKIQSGLDAQVACDMHIARIDDTQDGAVQFICAVIDQRSQIAQRTALQQSADALHQRHLELLSSQSRLAAIIDSSLDAIVGIDPGLHITVFNPAASRLFDCPAESALGKSVVDFIPALAPALAAPDARASLQLGEMNGARQSGQFVSLDVSLSREHSADGDIVTLFIRDLTTQKKLQAQHAALEAQLRESQKMQAIGTMAGGIAHDFNNIVAAIMGNVDLALQDVPADRTAVVASLQEIGKAGRRARDLVRQILAFSRNEPPRRLPLQLADVVRETNRLLNVALPPGIELRVDLDPATPLVLADGTQIEQVMLNLLHNAIDAIGSQIGQIHVSLSPQPTADALNNDLSNANSTEWVCLRVRDSGSGMDEATLKRIFEPFFTTKPVGRGTGLGLSVVHGIMLAHAGQVHVHSAPGKGTEFSLYFPAEMQPVTHQAPIPIHPVSKRGTGQRVMYVDDDEALIFLLQRVLSRKGYAVLTYSDPQAALQALRDDPARCDVLVTDFNMPGFSGVDLLRAARSICPRMPMALASGHITPEIERDALNAGARALLYKPNDVDEFCATVQQLLDDVPAPSCG